ncbi:UDP-N-acetylmuramate--L-alanine ligase [Meiothermus sp. PNK-Is4]|nr:UDP-N-acetylmuramate--L-alanine ligase [Meiothermus sp. Pnk-1]RYM39019.1 UDP-N-acetylmuramate--L-alanine ligase [Meiothermus sp. PNK-Is4]
MSGLAAILLQEGFQVSGCDTQMSDLTDGLKKQGAIIYQGHHPTHLEGVDRVVATTAIPEHEPELMEARRRNIPTLRRVQLLGEILSQGYSLGVTGSHGKTTTSAMLASIFLEAGTDPTVVLGAKLPSMGGSARHGKGRYRIAEVDESDPWFSHLALDVAVVLNLEPDHVGTPTEQRPNYHPDFSSLQEAVRRFARNARRLVYNAEWPGLEGLLLHPNRVSFGLERGHCHARNLGLFPMASRFEVVWNNEPLGVVELRVPGLHNVVDALAATAVALVEGLPFSAVQKALAAFRGAHRRFERLGEVRGAWLVDDYAHNPTKVRSALEAAKGTGRWVRAVFQPHRYLRTAQLWAELAEALSLADEALVLEVYSAGEPPIPGVSGRMIAERLIEKGHNAKFMGWNEALDYLQNNIKDGDLVLTIGAGDVWRLGHELLERAKERA